MNNVVNDFMGIIAQCDGGSYEGNETLQEQIESQRSSFYDWLKPILEEKHLNDVQKGRYNKYGTKKVKKSIWFQSVKKEKHKLPYSISVHVSKDNLKVSVELDVKNSGVKTRETYRSMLDDEDKAINPSFEYESISDTTVLATRNYNDVKTDPYKKQNVRIAINIAKDDSKKDEWYENEIKEAIEKLMPLYDDLLLKESWLSSTIDEALEERKQIVLTGAPGTGKTYAAKKYAEEAVGKKNLKDCYKLVQFHPSYDYSDFVEGLRPVKLGDTTSFVRVDGVFKDFCRKAAKNAIEAGEESAKTDLKKYYFIIDEINRADLSKVFGELMYCLEYRGVEGKVETQYRNLDTYVITKKGPRTFENIDDSDLDITDKCIKDVYGKKDIFKDGFYIPENVYIIGTMNDIDRSVETFDFALRRRFKWIDVSTEDVLYDVFTGLKKDKVGNWGAVSEKNIHDLMDKINKMNEILSGESGKQYFLSKAYNIGPAYFKNIKISGDQIDYNRVFDDYIQPILQEYLRAYEDTDEFIKSCRDCFDVKVKNG